MLAPALLFLLVLQTVYLAMKNGGLLNNVRFYIYVIWVVTKIITLLAFLFIVIFPNVLHVGWWWALAAMLFVWYVVFHFFFQDHWTRYADRKEMRELAYYFILGLSFVLTGVSAVLTWVYLGLYTAWPAMLILSAVFYTLASIMEFALILIPLLSWQGWSAVVANGDMAKRR